MRRWLAAAMPAFVLVAVVGLTASCQSGSKKLTPFGHDLDAICHSEQRSGALTHPEGQRGMIVAQWLGGQIQTEQGRAFLGELGRTPPDDKHALLMAESRRIGLADCPLARTWGPPAN